MLAPDDLLRDPRFRRLWLSVLTSSLGHQVTMIAVPLCAAVLLHATPTQMGWLTAAELTPFLLLSLPVGVWLDRVRKLPVHIGGEIVMALAILTIPLAWALDALDLPHLYVVMFVLGCVFVAGGAASQIVLTQVVERERLVEAHARNAMAGSLAEVLGPGVAGFLIKLVGAPLALLADAVMLAWSVLLLRGLRLKESLAERVHRGFGTELAEGLSFVRGQRLLLQLALIVGAWQGLQHAAMVVHILVAVRTLGLSESQVGLGYIGLGIGAVFAGAMGHRVSAALGPGRCMALGIGVTGIGWLLLAAATRTPDAWGRPAFAAMLLCFGVGAVLLMINFLSLRQAVTPAPLLGRMTSIMRWLTLLPAGPGALLGGWLGEHHGLATPLWLGGALALLLALWVGGVSRLRRLQRLPDAAA
ncbi:MAG: hypothetical protein RIQ96_1094 [Pseudomonadota bacterium]|jgi:MFS family permease